MSTIRTCASSPAEDYGIYAELNQSSDFTDFKNKLLTLINRIGFSDYGFLPLEGGWDNSIRLGLLSSYPEEFWYLYQSCKLNTHDALVHFARDNAFPIFTSLVYDHFCHVPFDNAVTRTNKAIRKLHHSFDIFEQYATPVIDTHSGRNYLLVLTERKVDVSTFQRKVIAMNRPYKALGQAIMNVFHSKYPEMLDIQTGGISGGVIKLQQSRSCSWTHNGENQ